MHKTEPKRLFRLDMQGEPCPYPAVATLEALADLEPGSILEVITDCPQAVNGIPFEVRRHGYELLEQRQEGPTLIFRVGVPEGKGRAAACR